MPVYRYFVFVAVALFLALPCRIVAAATIEYELTIAWQEVNMSGTPARAMTINGAIPGPILRFTEGDYARITVHNLMDTESSIHWHGLLVPPAMDGVPLISFPPIAAGTSFVYEFPIRQSGTYWYHSHTSLQEQRGIYGSIVIEPQHSTLAVDRDYVVLLSDWTDEDPHQVLRTLKRGSEWYALVKGSAQSLFGAARSGMLGAYLSRELQRMPAMDIADVAYDRFLANGAPEIALDAAPGETVRLRLIDGSATTFFYLDYAGGPLQIVAADGQDVEPLELSRLLIAVAETYDILVTVPAAGAWELRATAHDGSSAASVWIGSGTRHPAPSPPLPNLYAGMGGLTLQRIFALTPAESMGMSNTEVIAGRFDAPGMMGMDHGGHDMAGMAHDSGAGKSPAVAELEALFDSPESPAAAVDHSMHTMAGESGAKMPPVAEDLAALFDAQTPAMAPDAHAMHDLEPATGAKTEYDGHAGSGDSTEIAPTARSGKRYGNSFQPLAADVSAAARLAVDGMDPARPWPPYEQLRATRPTTLPTDAPIREVRLTLDGDMARYVWFLNDLALSESDDILIREGEVVRFIMINRTMMHHPMHLHGHFFRVVNGQGDYSPLKHTIDVAPMSTTVIEFEANEVGDWFFHCHLLYHMKSGMARAVHYENFPLPPPLTDLRPRLYRDSWYAWGQAEALSNMAEAALTLSNTRTSLRAEVEVGWQQVDQTEWETLLLLNRHVNRFTTFFIGANFGNELEDNRGVLGLHYLLPFNLETSGFIGSDGEFRAQVEREFQLLPRLALDGLVQYDSNSGWETVAGLSYTLGKTVSLLALWHTDYRWGGGLTVRF